MISLKFPPHRQVLLNDCPAASPRTTQRIGKVTALLDEVEVIEGRVWLNSNGVSTGTKSQISNSRLHTMAKVGVFTRPIPMTPRAPRPRMTVAVRVSDRL